MSIIDTFLTILTPYECLGCTVEGELLCTECAQRLPGIPGRCYRCLTPSPGALTCVQCAAASCLYRVRAGTAYAGIAKELILKLKFAGTQAATRQMAALLLPGLVVPHGRELLIVPVPTAASRVRRRGYDQAKLLSRELSRQSRLPYADCLARSGYTHQLGASRKQRHQQLKDAFRVNTPDKIQGRRIVLVDDVVTTGATLEAAARVLTSSGSGRVEAVVFCAA